MGSVAATARGWAVPLDGAVGEVAMVTGSALVCRLQADRPSVLVVHATTERPMAPLSIRLEPGLGLGPVAPGARITIDAGVLRIASHEVMASIGLQDAAVWAPGPAESLSAAEVARLAADIERAGGRAVAASGRRVGALVDGVVTALRRRDLAAVARCVGRLVGFGPGLTPSGDDVLCGVLLALARSPDMARERADLGDAVCELLGRTSALSACMLSLAVDGHGDEAVLDVFGRAVGESPFLGARRIERVLACGATSGADVLFGIRAGLGMTMALVRIAS
jgi:hypothetical protein